MNNSNTDNHRDHIVDAVMSALDPKDHDHTTFELVRWCVEQEPARAPLWSDEEIIDLVIQRWFAKHAEMMRYPFFIPGTFLSSPKTVFALSTADQNLHRPTTPHVWRQEPRTRSITTALAKRACALSRQHARHRSRN